MDRILAKQKITYSQVLDKLSLPPDTDKVKRCSFCGNLLHLIKVNPIVGFWVHKGEDVKKCGEANKMHPGKPMIVQNMNFYRRMAEIWGGIRQAKENKKDGGNTKD
jgi:hypothetical protein